MSGDDTLDGSDRKARYVGANPTEVERIADLRARFAHCEAMDESLDGLNADAYFDIPLPTDATIMKASWLTRKEWDAIKLRNRDIIADYLVCHTGGHNYFRRELVNIIKSLRGHLLESMSQADLLKAQAARARACSRGAVNKGCIRTPEQKERMRQGQLKRYARARLKKENE